MKLYYKFLILFALFFSVKSFSATHTVTETTVDNIAIPGCLRYILDIALPGDIIEFAPSTNGNNIMLYAPLFIDEDIEFIGNGINNTVIDGLNNTRLFDIQSLQSSILNVSFENISFVRGGNSYGHSAIYSRSSILAFNDCLFERNINYGALHTYNSELNINRTKFRDNSRPQSGGAILSYRTKLVCKNSNFTGNESVDGGAIYVFNDAANKSVIIEDCNFHENIALSTGAAVFVLFSSDVIIDSVYASQNDTKWGTIVINGSNNGHVKINKSTISQNESLSGYSGLSISVSGQQSNVLISNTTISSNASNEPITNPGLTEALGLYGANSAIIEHCTIAENIINGGRVINFLNVGTLKVINSILSGNQLLNNSVDLLVSGSTNIVSNGHNIIGKYTGSNVWQPTDIVGGPIGYDPKLMPLNTYGGSLPVHLPACGSDAIDGGQQFNVFDDQRGVSRYNQASGLNPDIGAVEFQHPTFIGNYPKTVCEDTCHNVQVVNNDADYWSISSTYFSKDLPTPSINQISQNEACVPINSQSENVKFGIIDSNNCVYETEPIKFIVSSKDCTGFWDTCCELGDNNPKQVEGIDIDFNLNLYPNPAKNTFSISADSKINTVKLYTMSGQQVKVFKAQPEYNISTLVKGMYFVTIEFDDGQLTNKKIIKN